MTSDTEAERVVAGLTTRERKAMLDFPDLRDANSWRFEAAVTHSNIWRKLTKHFQAFRSLEERGVVESKVSRGETLWRPTRPLGLAVRTILKQEQKS